MTAADRPGDVPVVPFVEPAPVALPAVEAVPAKGDPVFEEQRRVAAAAVERARG